MHRRLFLALALLAPLSSLAAQDAPLTVFVVRHAEKGPETPDPSLTDAGRRRAASLARTLADAHITALYASEFKRTQETLAPLARATGLTPMVVYAGQMDDLIAMLRALPAGSRAVVASHSNLVHLIVERLSGQTVPALGDLDYDRIVVVTVPAGGKGQAVVLRYGEP
jgi:broad specificity phosphatase PhoE